MGMRDKYVTDAIRSRGTRSRRSSSAHKLSDMMCCGRAFAADAPKATTAAIANVSVRRSTSDFGLYAGVEAASGLQESVRVLIVFVEDVGDASVNGEHVVDLVIHRHIG